MTENYIAEGGHAALCRSVQFNTTKDGNEQVAIGFEIVGDDQDAGRMVTYFGTFQDAKDGKKRGAVDFTIEALRNIGFVGDDLSELPTLAESGQLAQEVSIVIAHEEYPVGSGEWKTKVKWVNRPGGGAIKLENPLDDRQLKAFAATMKSRLRGSAGGRPAQGSGGGSRQGSVPHPNAPGGGLDDIPFASSLVEHEQSALSRLVRSPF